MEENKDIQSEAVKEEDLEAVAGGRPTWNRYDPKTCKNMTRTKYECVGLLSAAWCDHYRGKDLGNNRKRISCAKGAFPEYIGYSNGDPA